MAIKDAALWVGLVFLAVASFVDGAPKINTYTKVASVYEKTTVNEILSIIDCSDPDGDTTNTIVKSMSPSNPCANCFQILDCAPDECLQYRAGVGTLNYGLAKSYIITIECQDGTETPDKEVIEIKVLPNSPPFFNPDSFFVDVTQDATASPAGTVIYDVDADDNENDDITYSLQVVPTSSAAHYQINSVTGEITSTVDLRKECRDDVSLLVTASDGTSSVGPLVINVALANANTAPIATNLATIVQIPEDKTGTAYAMNFVDGDGDAVTYTVSATNTAGLAQFTIDGTNPNIDIASALNYEVAGLRQTDLLIKATDGYCTSPQYTLRLQVTDVNEKPVVSPVTSSIEVCEGKREFDGGFTVTDEDTPDTKKYSLHPSVNNVYGRFGVNPTNGYLRTLIDLDVDTGMTPTKQYIVLVEDKGGLTATAVVDVTFLDCNDNAPVFDEPVYTTASTECAAAGTVLRTVAAKDADSAREQNNVIYYEGSAGAVSVGTGGEVVLNYPLPAGSVITFSAYAYDKGQTPGPLKSKNPAVISVRFTPCPTTQPPVTAAATTTTTTTTTTTSTTTSSYTNDEDNTAWIIIAALLGTFLLGLIIFMLWRYWPLCLNACDKFQCKIRCCKERVVRPIRSRPIERRPPEPRRRKPEVPEEPAGPGFLFGFWKERYPDDDFQNQPDRKALPAPGDMDNHYPHTIDTVEGQSKPTGVAEAAPKKKKCTIL